MGFLLLHFGVEHNVKEFADSGITGADVKDGISKDVADMVGIKTGGKLFALNAHIKRANEANEGVLTFGESLFCCIDCLTLFQLQLQLQLPLSKHHSHVRTLLQVVIPCILTPDRPH